LTLTSEKRNADVSLKKLDLSEGVGQANAGKNRDGGGCSASKFTIGQCAHVRSALGRAWGSGFLQYSFIFV
jgi:hypothetical protein